MKTMTLVLLAGSFVVSILAGEKSIVVRDNPDVYTFKAEPFDGKGHGDGVASLDFTGIVVQEVEGKEIPLANVTFSVEPNHSFADWRNEQIIFLSNTNGQFLARLYVGAAMAFGGKTPGRVYQTRRSKLRIEKGGYKTQFLWFDYEMPQVKIIMMREDTQQDKSSVRDNPRR